MSSIVPLLSLAAMGGMAWHRANSVPLEVRAHAGFLQALCFRASQQPLIPPSAAAIASQRPAAKALKSRLADEFPALQIANQPVPAETNAYLLLHRLAAAIHSGSNKLPLGDDFKKLLTAPPSQWDPTAARRCLATHGKLIDQVEYIAGLTTRSSADMPRNYQGTLDMTPGKYGCEILLLKARLAADAHDEQEALRLVTAALNLSAHYSQVDGSSLYNTSVAVLTDMEIHRVVITNLLPTLGRDTGLVQWRAALVRRQYDTAALADVIRGEWNNAADYFFLPVILATKDRQQLPDVETVARVASAWFNELVTRLPNCALAEAADLIHPPRQTATLSTQGRRLVADFAPNLTTWTRGYVRAATVLAQHQAALDLLILEQAGFDLTEEAAAYVTLDPLSGLPFRFDPAKRLVSVPSSAVTATSQSVKPLALPW